MSAEELQREVQSLRERLQREKEEMAKLRDENDRLVGRISDKGEGVTEQPRPQSPTELPRQQTTKISDYVIYLPKDKKVKTFTGGSGAVFYEWWDDIQISMNFRPFSDEEKAAYIYEHLGGEARDEIKYRPLAVRKHFKSIYDVLVESYGGKQSLIKLQRQFFDRRQKEGESLREYSHALLAIIEEIHRNSKKETCSDLTLRDQFVENVYDPALCRELKQVVKQSPEISFFDLRKEAIQWEEEVEKPGKRVQKHTETFEHSVIPVGECSAINVQPKGDPVLSEILNTIKKQQAQLDEVTQTLSGMRRPWGRGGGIGRQEPRYDPSGKPICFRCQIAGHIARNCPKSQSQSGNLAKVNSSNNNGSSVKVAEQQGNSCPP